MKRILAILLVTIYCRNQAFAFVPVHPTLPVTQKTEPIVALHYSFRYFSTDPVDPLPFVIEAVKPEAGDHIYKEISNLCIQAFFNDGVDKTPLWKELQLGYLRSLQQGDLRRRRSRYPESNAMFLARRVYPLSEQPDLYMTSPLILDLSRIYNNPNVANDEEFVRGEILGFVEVTQRPYGLGNQAVGFERENGNRQQTRYNDYNAKRPVLTNLSVREDARQSGIGSKLVEACEDVALNQWGMKEIILEVEEDNLSVQKFYEKRGYSVLFEDPASRRYDANGLWLRQVRCKRIIMRKVLSIPEMIVENSVGKFFGMNILQRIRDNMFANV
jgi:ribosomal protein S18 acetylase RimI-like enzyme